MTKPIVVAGDFVLDRHIYEGRRHQYADETTHVVRVVEQLGGAALIRDLLGQLLNEDKKDDCLHLAIEEPDLKVVRVAAPLHAYAVWRPFPKAATGGDPRYWRVSEVTGFGGHSGIVTADELQEWTPRKDLPNPDVLVVSEGGMGFRTEKDDWKELLVRKKPPRWIILKTAAPIADGALWEKLSAEYRDHLIVVVTARHLRRSAARLVSGLSWDESVESLLRELQPGGALADLTQCRHLVVAFEAEGGVWIDLERKEDGSPAQERPVHFVYDAPAIEGDDDHEIPGTAFGFLSCLAAAFAWEAWHDEPDWLAALEGGLSAMRDLRERGHGPANEEPKGFPAGRLAGVIKAPRHRYSRMTIPFSSQPGTSNPGSSPRLWSLLAESQREKGPAFDLARLVVRHGPIALENLPHLKVGKLITVDRREVEALRTLGQVIRRYRDDRKATKPLSIGVFGPPSSGKSFAAKQLAEHFVGKSSWMEFNLTQFDVADLHGAFHQIRDRVLQGQLPVAFFDEFDSQEYRWLQYLLAPLHDGKYQEGPLTHTMGRCILVFAGGPSSTFSSFGPPQARDPGEKESEGHARLQLAKGLDFQSRLDAYLEVSGPNLREVCAGAQQLTPGPYGSGSEAETNNICFPIRRALMIRSNLGCGYDDHLDIDQGLLHALLHVPKYTHGSRSLGKVLEPLKAVGPAALYRSLLPPVNQLAMHVGSGEAFLALCHEAVTPVEAAELPEDDVEPVAEAIHRTYRELGRKMGWLKLNESKQEGWGEPLGARDFKELCGSDRADFLRASNYAAARRMPSVLAIVGLELKEGAVETEDERRNERAVRQHIEHHLELLAAAEHQGWMDWHFQQGWTYASKRNNDKKQHPCFLPFSKLADEDKNKDRTQVRHYPNFVHAARMRIDFFDTQTTKTPLVDQNPPVARTNAADDDAPAFPQRHVAPCDLKDSYIFRSYKRNEWNRVFPHLSHISARGYPIWYDRGIPGGSEWHAVIAEKVRNCILFIAFLSRSAVGSKWIKREIAFADAMDKRILAVTMEPVELPPGLSITLSSQQMISGAADEVNLELERAIRLFVGQ